MAWIVARRRFFKVFIRFYIFFILFILGYNYNVVLFFSALFGYSLLNGGGGGCWSFAELRFSP